MDNDWIEEKKIWVHVPMLTTTINPFGADPFGPYILFYFWWMFPLSWLHLPSSLTPKLQPPDHDTLVDLSTYPLGITPKLSTNPPTCLYIALIYVFTTHLSIYIVSLGWLLIIPTLGDHKKWCKIETTCRYCKELFVVFWSNIQYSWKYKANCRCKYCSSGQVY